jgi:O-antigen/teichoic acid export membrane protein
VSAPAPQPPPRSRDPFARARLGGAVGWRLAYLAIQGVGSILLFSSLGHVLGRNAFAATAVALGVTVIAQSIGDFGLSQAAVTVLPTRVAARPESAPELLAGAALAYFGAAVLGFALTLGGALLVPSAAFWPVAVSAPAAAATVLVSGADGILRSQAEFRRPVLLMACSEGAGFVGLPVAILTHSAVWTCAAISVGMALGAAGSVVTLVRLRRTRTTVAVRPFVRASFPLGLSQVFIALGTRADTLLAGALSGLLAAGTFEGAWRIYQLGQYAVGGVASAAAPFIADAVGAGRNKDGLRLLRQLFTALLVLGTAGGAALYLGRIPIANVLAGSLAVPVARVVPTFALVSPIAAVGLVGFFTLIGRDGQRRYVLGAIAAGAMANLALAALLAPRMGVRGVVTGCAVGQAIVSLLLLIRLAFVARELRDEDNARHGGASHTGLAQRSG